MVELNRFLLLHGIKSTRRTKLRPHLIEMSQITLEATYAPELVEYWAQKYKEAKEALDAQVRAHPAG